MVVVSVDERARRTASETRLSLRYLAERVVALESLTEALWAALRASEERCDQFAGRAERGTSTPDS